MQRRRHSECIQEEVIYVGDLSEEALEARHKNFRSYRANLARKFSREATNRDIFTRLWLTSDPVINSKRRNRNSSSNHSIKALEFLIVQQITSEYVYNYFELLLDTKTTLFYFSTS